MKDTQPGRSAPELIWSFFASVKLSFFLFLTLAVASIFGTLIPQREHLHVYTKAYGETGARIIQALSLDDMYHSYWFLLLLTLLAVNLVICSLNRLPLALKVIRKDPAAEAKRVRKAWRSFTVDGGVQDNQDRLGQELGRVAGKVHRAEADGGVNLFAQRGAWSRLGVYLVHASVLIIFIGAIVGNLWGFDGRVFIAEGQTVDHILIQRGKKLPLGFGVRLDKFTITYYKGSRMPSEYISELVFINHGKEVKKWRLKVNHPADFKGIDFYQSSYDQQLKSVKVLLTRKGQEPREVQLHFQRWSKLPGGGEAGVQDFRPQVDMGGMYRGAVARILYRAPDKQPVALTAFEPGARMASRGEVAFQLKGWDMVSRTGLSVKYDPGVWFVWIGCILMTLGFLVTFYTSHRKVWLRLTPAGKGRTRVEIAGSANRNRVGLQRAMERLEQSIRNQKGKAE